MDIGEIERIWEVEPLEVPDLEPAPAETSGRSIPSSPMSSSTVIVTRPPRVTLHLPRRQGSMNDLGKPVGGESVWVGGPMDGRVLRGSTVVDSLAGQDLRDAEADDAAAIGHAR